jgi:hypothetical protein
VVVVAASTWMEVVQLARLLRQHCLHHLAIPPAWTRCQNSMYTIASGLAGDDWCCLQHWYVAPQQRTSQGNQ